MKKYAAPLTLALAFVLALSRHGFAAAPALAPVVQDTAEKPSIMGLLGALAMAFIQLFISLGLAMYAIKIAIDKFDSFTKDIDEQAELRKGNMAVGILLAAVIYSIANVIASGVSGLTTAIKPGLNWEFVIGLGVGIVNLLVGIWIATFTISMALKVLDKITKDIDEMREIQKGNAAVAVVMAGVLIAVSTIIAQGVEGISKILEARQVWDALKGTFS